MKILIVKLGAIGDIVHTLPAVAEIRRNFPDAEITWLAENRSAAILRGSPILDELVEIDTRAIKKPRMIGTFREAIGDQIKELRNAKYDIAVDFQGLLKSAVAAKMSGASVRWGFSRKDLRESAARVFYTDTAAQIGEKTHIVNKNLALAREAFQIKAAAEELKYPITVDDTERTEISEFIEDSVPFALLNPGGGWPTKLWHAEKFGLLVDMLYEKLGIRSIISVGPGEEQLAKRAMQNSKSGASNVANLSIKGFYELAKYAEVYVGGDTGPTHIAIAAGAPVVGIFGPTEWWRNGSLAADDICVGREDIECRIDCHRRSCNKWICMDIDVETVFDAVERRINEAAAVKISSN